MRSFEVSEIVTAPYMCRLGNKIATSQIVRVTHTWRTVAHPAEPHELAHATLYSLQLHLVGLLKSAH